MAKLDEIGKPAWILIVILAFLAWWPLGFAMLAFLYGSRRMRFGKGGGIGRWYNTRCEGGGSWSASRSASGNRAFDEYREATLRRLEEEQREFRDFLERLRMAKDKAEFDEFMAERRRRPDAPGPVSDVHA